MKKPNILHLIGEFTSGGAETIVINLINRLKKDNWNVIVSARKDGPLSEQIIDKKDIYIIDKNRTIDIKYIFNIELIHTHLFGNDFYGFFAAKYAGIKIIQTIHGMDSINSRKRILAYNIMAPFVDKIITVSESLEQEMLKVILFRKDKIYTITNGIDCGRYVSINSCQSMKEEIGINDSFPIIGAVGNVKPVKGYDTFIKAASLILKQYPKVKFLIVGSVSEHNSCIYEMERLIYVYGLEKYFEFLGFRQDVHDILSLFDIYVLPSRSEGLSMALLEAMLLGKPIVATSVGGNLKVLENCKTALLVPPNEPEALSESILHLLSNKAFAKFIGQNASEECRKKYNIDHMVENYKNLYLKLVN